MCDKLKLTSTFDDVEVEWVQFKNQPRVLRVHMSQANESEKNEQGNKLKVTRAMIQLVTDSR